MLGYAWTLSPRWSKWTFLPHIEISPPLLVEASNCGGFERDDLRQIPFLMRGTN